MQIETKRWGTVTIAPGRVLKFAGGLNDVHKGERWALLAYTDRDQLAWLQSLDDPKAALLVADPAAWIYSYTPAIPRDTRIALGLADDAAGPPEILMLLDVTVKGGEAVVDLTRPWVINGTTLQGARIQTDPAEQWHDAQPIDLAQTDDEEETDSAAA